MEFITFAYTIPMIVESFNDEQGNRYSNKIILSKSDKNHCNFHTLLKIMLLVELLLNFTFHVD